VTLIISGIPSELGDKLVEEYLDIKKHYSMSDWGPSQLKGGRFAEVMLRIYQYLLGEAAAPFGVDIPANAKTRILNSVQNHPNVDEHIRQKTVALARLLLDFRNNRDVAHLGGFNASSMDSLFVMTSATWVLCEIVRVYGGYPMMQAQEIVDGLSIKDYPVIFERDGELFIARHDLKAEKEVLVLLARNDKADFSFLFSKTKDRNKSRFEGKLEEMIASKLVGKKGADYFLMPRGAATVAKERLLTYTP
jgi:hypothetical protein